jgi:hypothetical protein
MELPAIILRAAAVLTASNNLRLQGNRFYNLHFYLEKCDRPEFLEQPLGPAVGVFSLKTDRNKK